jgi:hypothetical protein
VLAVSTVAAPGLAQEAPIAAGTASASTQVLRARLFYGGFPIEVTAGTAVAEYRNATARSFASSLDLASVLGLVGLPSTTPATATSRNGGEATEQTLASPIVGLAKARADDQPAAGATSDLVDLSLPGILEVIGGHTESHAEFVPGSHRAASAVTEIARISLAGGLVELRGLRWTARHRTGAGADSSADFQIGSVALAGVELPIDGAQLSGTLAILNAVLAPTGLVVGAPESVQLPDGSIDISSLRIGIANSPLGAQLIAPVVSGLRPLLLPLLGAASDASPQLGLLGLVLDLAIGVADGSGGLILSLGGANANSGDVMQNSSLGGGPTSAPPGVAAASPVPTDTAGTRPADASTLGSPRVAIAASSPETNAGPLECTLSAAPQRHGSCRGRNLPAAAASIALTAAGIGLLEVRARRGGRGVRDLVRGSQP